MDLVYSLHSSIHLLSSTFPRLPSTVHLLLCAIRLLPCTVVTLLPSTLHSLHSTTHLLPPAYLPRSTFHLLPCTVYLLLFTVYLVRDALLDRSETRSRALLYQLGPRLERAIWIGQRLDRTHYSTGSVQDSSAPYAFAMSLLQGMNHLPSAQLTVKVWASFASAAA